MQSGISVSQDLKDAFNGLAESGNQRGLIATIESESVKPLQPIPSNSSSFFQDLPILQSLLSETRAVFLLLRRYPDVPDGYVAVTFVPDAAPVRQKMLFASTRLSLVRELGEERFRDKLFVTELKDLTQEGWEKHEASDASSAPLTAEEASLQGVKEAEATEIGGTGGRRLATGVGHSMPMSDDAHTAVSSLRDAPIGTLVQLYIDVKTERIELASKTETTGPNLKTAISDTAARYSLFKPRRTQSSPSDGPLLFIYSCPSGLGIKDRMLHAGSKVGFLYAIEKDFGVAVFRKLEVSSPFEIDDSALAEAREPQAEQKQGFSRPKRPGRR